MNELNSYDAEYNKQLRDATNCGYQGPRDPDKSNLASDESYMSFLKKACGACSEAADCELGIFESISVSWTTGGTSGASCWGGESIYPIRPDPPKELNELDIILEAVVPSLTFLQYKRITKNVVINNTWSNSDYYGNTDYKQSLTAVMYDLYCVLLEMNLIKE